MHTNDSDAQLALVWEAQRILAELDVLYCRIGVRVEECTHTPPCDEDPYNDYYQDRIDRIYGLALRRLERRERMGVVSD